MTAAEPGVIWVRSDIAADGTYVVAMETDQDTSFVMDRDTAVAHVFAVVDVAQRAAYDAAVIAQLTKTGVDLDAAVELVAGIRADRPPVVIPGPLELVPGVSQKTREPFLTVQVNGKPVGQWTVEDAEQHATYVLGAVAVADLDSGYYRALRGMLQLDEQRARNVVDDLANHR